MSLFKINVDADSLDLFPTNNTSFESLSDIDNSFSSDSDETSSLSDLPLSDTSSTKSSSGRRVGFSDDVTLVAFEKKKGDALVDELVFESVGGMDEVKELYKLHHAKNKSKLSKYIKKIFNKN
jgi:hypothetical protein